MKLWKKRYMIVGSEITKKQLAQSREGFHMGKLYNTKEEAIKVKGTTKGVKIIRWVW